MWRASRCREPRRFHRQALPHKKPPPQYSFVDHKTMTSDQVDKAVEALKQGKIHGVINAAHYYGVAPSTLKHRLHGWSSFRKARESQQVLTATEEEALVQWCKTLVKWGLPASYKFLKEMAEFVCSKRCGGRWSEFTEHNHVGKNWATGFLKRHPDIKGLPRFTSPYKCI